MFNWIKMLKKHKKLMVFGTFDIFHKGHESFLKQARKYGDYLIVVVARDVNVKKIKGRKPQNKENKRLEIIKTSGLANKVVLGDLKNKYIVIGKYKPDIICLGYDQLVDISELKKNLLKFNLKNVKIKRLRAFKPEIYKSSKLKSTK